MKYRKNCIHYLDTTKTIRGIDSPQGDVIGGPGCRRHMMIGGIECKSDCEGSLLVNISHELA
jgi:hypothetical protein